MKQGNYKSLILKLSGSAAGLALMLAGAVTLGQNFLVDKSTPALNTDNYPSTSPVVYSDHSLSPEELKLTLSMNEEFRIVVESGKFQADKAMRKALIALEAMKSEQFESQLEINSDKIESLREAIRDVAEKISIPSALKKVIIADLERQLAKTEKKLGALEENIITFSYKAILPQSKYVNSGQCDQEAVVVEKCSGGACVDDARGSRSKQDRKGSVAAFYWI